MIKRIFSQICSFIMALTEASYAAHLSRNQQWNKAKSLYKD